MQICFITPSLEKGGMERVLCELANFGIKLGYSISILCILPSRKVAYYLDPKVEVIEPTYHYANNIIFKFKSLIYLIKHLNDIKPYTVLSFSETFNPMAISAGFLTQTPIFISDRSNPLKEVSRFKDLLKRSLYPQAQGLISQTSFAENIFRQKDFNKNIRTIPNPLRTTDYSDSLDSHLSKKVILSMGRLVKSKNFDQLIRIFSRIENNDWKLWILGGGPERGMLENLIAKLNLEGKVTLKGEVEDPDFYFSKASIFAFTSLSEGFPNALSEAMAFPLACISFDCNAGPSDIIEDMKNGFLIPLDNEDLYLNRLKQLIDSEDLRTKLATEAIKNRQKFSPDNSSKKYFEFITTLK